MYMTWSIKPIIERKIDRKRTKKKFQEISKEKLDGVCYQEVKREVEGRERWNLHHRQEPSSYINYDDVSRIYQILSQSVELFILGCVQQKSSQIFTFIIASRARDYVRADFGYSSA